MVFKLLRVAASFIKRRTEVFNEGWDNKVNDILLTMMMEEMITKTYQEDPMQGKRYVDDPELDLWVKASSLATGARWRCYRVCKLVAKRKECTAHKLGRAQLCAKRC